MTVKNITERNAREKIGMKFLNETLDREESDGNAAKELFVRAAVECV